MKTLTEHKARLTEDGSILTVLLGGIGLIALISLSLFQLMSGPLSSAAGVTQRNLVQTEMLTISRIAIVDAANQSDQGDCDTDYFIEPRSWRDPDGGASPVNGGLIPFAMGAPTVDPWGTEYGYCVWDVGPLSDEAACGGAAARLEGSPNPRSGEPQSRTILAVISAGPDRAFQTTCNEYIDASTDLVTTGDDDLIQRFSYEEASNTAPELWTIEVDDPDTAGIDKNLEIGEDITLTTGTGLIQATLIDTIGRITAGGGVQLGDQTTVLDASCVTSTAGLIRFNTTLNSIELCLNNGAWQVVDGVTWPLLAADGFDSIPAYGFENYTESGMFHSPDGLSFVSEVDNLTLYATAEPDFRVISEGGVQVNYSSTACDSDTEGTLKYVTFMQGFQMCNGDEWTPLYDEDSCAADELEALEIGEKCRGIVYAGTSGGNKIYTTTANMGLTPANDGTESHAETSADSETDGMANTNTIVGFTGAGSPYTAAALCRSMGAEWYLPSIDELGVLYTNNAAIGGFNTDGLDVESLLWSSTEVSSTNMSAYQFGAGSSYSELKETPLQVRCVRQ